MNNMDIIQKEGYRILKPKEGYILYKDGEVYEQVMLGANMSPSAYMTIPDENYQAIIKELTSDPLEELKKQRIALSKNNLVEFLKDNPLFSTAKYKEGRYYNVTDERQSQLARMLLSYQLDILSGKDSTLTWNDTGSICEDWSYEQLRQLSHEIKEYVTPFIKKQQKMEVKIKEAKTEKEIFNIRLDFEIGDENE